MNIAQQVIEKCGGVSKTAKIVGKSESWVSRWTYPKNRGGTNGRVPQGAQIKLLEAASRGEVDLEASDFFPPMTRAAQ